MAISSDNSSVLSGEECEKGLLLLFPTELLLRHLIGTCGVSPRAAGSVPPFPGSCIAYPVPVPTVHQATRTFPGYCPVLAHHRAQAGL